MDNLELRPEEKKDLEKRGFFVVSNFSFLDLARNIINILLYIGILIVPYMFFCALAMVFFNIIHLYDEIYLIIASSLFFILASAPIIVFLITFLFSGKTFYEGKGNVIEFGSIGKAKSKWRKFLFIFDARRKILNKSDIGRLIMTLGIFYLIINTMGLIVFMVLLSLGNIAGTLLNNVLLPIVYFNGFLIFLIILRWLFQHFHPLYAFGNLGEKIQKLTPTIESQSKMIQSEFQKDQNFGVLHSGFEKLSSTFSGIVSLVIKLERVEARANKGNLFDSKKYINSLRSDIIDPLYSLKSFLERQRIELKKSQKELSKVRVGGSDESGNRELASKRGDILLEELGTNIVALEEMIGKMK